MRRSHKAGRQRMVALVAEAAGQFHFTEAALVGDLETIAVASYVDEDGIRAAIAEGWHQAVREGLADGILTQVEEVRLRDVREQLAIQAEEKGAQGATAELNRAARDPLVLDARLAALATTPGDGHLDDLAHTIEESEFSPSERSLMLVQDWEAAVEVTVQI